MDEFQKNIQEIETLYLTPNLQNKNIVKSHILEILLSFSTTPQFIEIIKTKQKFLKKILTTIYEIPELSYKVLLILINLSNDPMISQTLTSFNCVKHVKTLIFERMKKIGKNHIKIENTLLKEDQKNEKDCKLKVFQISDEKIKSEDTDLLLEVDTIRISMLFLNNLVFHCENAKNEVIGEGAEECNFILILSDWMLDVNLSSLFANFLDVLVNISNKKELRIVLIKKFTKKIFKLFDFYLFNSQVMHLEKVYKILRNLSFEQENIELLDIVCKSSFFKNNLYIFENQAITNDQKSDFATFFIDIFAALYTSTNFDNYLEKDLLFSKDFKLVLEELRMVCLKKAEVVDRLEVLEAITSEFINSQNNVIKAE